MWRVQVKKEPVLLPVPFFKTGNGESAEGCALPFPTTELLKQQLAREAGQESPSDRQPWGGWTEGQKSSGSHCPHHYHVSCGGVAMWADREVLLTLAPLPHWKLLSRWVRWAGLHSIHHLLFNRADEEKQQWQHIWWVICLTSDLPSTGQDGIPCKKYCESPFTYSNSKIWPYMWIHKSADQGLTDRRQISQANNPPSPSLENNLKNWGKWGRV